MASVTPPSRKKCKRNEGHQEEGEVGFKFSRQSRYRKDAQKKGSGSKSTRKRRRSSFAQGRNKRKSLVFSSASVEKSELYREIPADLPTEERFQKLFDACLKGAIEKLDTHSSEFNIDGLLNFSEEAKEVFSQLRALITDSAIVSEAFKPSSSKVEQIPNPKNTELDAKLASFLAATERWKSESQQWDNLLEFHQELAAKKERKQNEDSTQGAADQCPDFLSPEQHQLLSGKPSLKGLMERVHEMKQKTFLQVDEVARAVNILKEYQEAASGFINANVKTFAKKTFEPVSQTGTPRTVIPRLLRKL